MAITIDTKSGAPASVRAAVGSMEHLGDRLKVLRQFYPDAEPDPVDPGNFIYTDPKTHRLTLYNPKGLDVGDVASVGPEVGEMAGGAMGAAGGGLLGLAGGPVGAVGSGIAGAGLGAAAGREITGLGARMLAGATDPRSLGAHLANTAETAGVNALGEGAGRAVLAATPGLRNFAFDRVGQLMDQYNIPGTLGQRTGSGGLMGIEAGLAQAPLGGSIRDIGQASREAGGAAANRAAVGSLPTGLRPGSALPVLASGRADIVGPAITRAAERHAARVEQTLEGIGRDAAATGTTVDAQAVRQLRAQLETELQRAPESQAAALRRGIEEADNIIADAATTGGIDFRTALRVRTQLGQKLADVAPGGIRPLEASTLDRVYGAWRNDIYSAAREADQASARAPRPTNVNQRLQTHDIDITSLRDPALGGQQTVLERLGKTVGTDALTSTMDTHALLTKPNQTRALLEGLTRNGEGEAAGQLRASLLNEIGRGKAGTQSAAGDTFSFNTLLTNYDDARRSGALDAIFPRSGSTGQTRRALDDLAEISGRMREAESRRNTSNTAGAAASLALAGGLGAGVYNLADTGNAGTLGAVLAGAAAPFVSARLLTSPGFARWLVRAFNAADSGVTTNVAGHLGRLAAMDISDAGARADRDAFIDSLRTDPTLGPLLEKDGKRGTGKRSEAEPVAPPVAPPGLLVPAQTAQAGPVLPPGMPQGMPPGLMGPDPLAAAASAQFAQNTAGPDQLGNLPPGLLTNADPSTLLQSLIG
jgi:hypothetical protein